MLSTLLTLHTLYILYIRLTGYAIYLAMEEDLDQQSKTKRCPQREHDQIKHFSFSQPKIKKQWNIS